MGSIIVVSILIGINIVSGGTLKIRTDIQNAVQTISKVIITEDGTSSTPEVMIFDGHPTSGHSQVQVNGAMTIGDQDDPIAVFDGRDTATDETKVMIFGKMQVGNTGNYIATGNQRSTIAGGEDNTLDGDSSTIAG